MADPVAEAAALASSRKRVQMKIPESARSLESDPSVVVLQQITLSEERRAMDASSGVAGQFATEMLKHFVTAADGKEIGWKDGGKERFLDGCSPKVRSLLMQAFERLHVPSEKETDDFFSSLTILA